MKKKRLIFAFTVSTLLTSIVGLLSDLAATHLSTHLGNQEWLIYGVLAVTFIISLPLSIYLFLRNLPGAQLHTPASVPIPTQARAQLETRSSAVPDLPGKAYRELVGRDTLMRQVMAALRDPSEKWVVTIDGMGGIGKTALAREVVDRCQVEHMFDAVVWDQAPKKVLAVGDYGDGTRALTYETVLDSIARQLGALDVLKLRGSEKEAQIRSLLQAQRVLVVLDNLETAGESQNKIACRLLSLLDPSKSLLTSRHRFQGDLHTIHLTGLDEYGSLRLIRQVAEDRNIARVQNATPEELKQIAEASGGSPLGLKLVTGQLAGPLPLNVVLGRLREVRLPEDGTGENEYTSFYKHIFLRSWRLLSRPAATLLISMAHFAPGVGGTYEAVKATSGLADELLNHNIEQLWRFSFLEIDEAPGLLDTRYYLHALTQNFVLSDITQNNDARPDQAIL